MSFLLAVFSYISRHINQSQLIMKKASTFDNY